MEQSFAPQESSSDLWTERIELIGTIVEGVVYGMHVCVIVFIFSVSRDAMSTKLKRLLSCGVFLLFAFATIMLACQVNLLEVMWIDERDIPGGPIVWIGIQYTLKSGVLTLSTFVVASFLADSFLILRLFVIWNNNYYIIIIPCLSNIASAILRGFVITQSIHPNSSFTLGSRETVVPYYVLTISLNIILTLGILGRLLFARRSVLSIMGSDHAKTYISLSAMFVESSALTSISGAFALACYIRNSDLVHLALVLYDQILCLAPQLVALRVALGRAWKSDTISGQMSPVGFKQCSSKQDSATSTRSNDASV